ncbi:hypothetical protein JW948_04630 [bacterium]|nr:hypothetical protein [bacterium]
MAPFKESVKSPIVHVAFVSGLSIILLAWFSKRVLSEPIGYLQLAIPPFIGTVFSSLYDKHKNSRWFKPWYWISAVIVATVLVIVIR